MNSTELYSTIALHGLIFTFVEIYLVVFLFDFHDELVKHLLSVGVKDILK